MKVVLALASAAVFTWTCGSLAQAQTQTSLSERVAFADLDLSRAGARQVLERRIQMAVTRVCPARPLPMELRKQDTYRTCRTAAWNGARQQLEQIYSNNQLAQRDVKVAARAEPSR